MFLKRNFFGFILVCLVLAVIGSGCATKGWVKTEVKTQAEKDAEAREALSKHFGTVSKLQFFKKLVKTN